MLDEPERDEARIAADRAVAQAVRARLALDHAATPDAAALETRSVLVGLTGAQAATVRALLGRIEAAGDPLVVCGPVSQVLAADRFGLVARAVAESEAALAEVRAGVRALIDLGAGRAWWGRLLAAPDLRVVAALPDDGARPRALMVRAASPGPTGDDRTFWVTDSAWADARIVETLGATGLAAEPLLAAGGLKLFVLAGYVQQEDGRLDGAPGRLTGVIGAAPIFREPA